MLFRSDDDDDDDLDAADADAYYTADEQMSIREDTDACTNVPS